MQSRWCSIVLSLAVWPVFAQDASPDSGISGDALENARQLQSWLAGDWAWEPEHCADDPIRISSSADGREMYHDTKAGLTSGVAIPARQRLLYRVLDSRDSRLRLALADETRQDASGKPVIWELVMMDPDRFCWRQADWPADGCTRPLARCPAAVVPPMPLQP